MSTSKERAPVSEIDDRLIELYVRQDEARKAENRELQSRSIRPERSGRRSAAEALRIIVNSGRIKMAKARGRTPKARGRTQRRHVREKATIDHLVQDVFEPKARDGEHTGHSPAAIIEPADLPRLGLVGEHVQAGFERGGDPIDLAAVAAREDGDPARRLIPYPIEKIGAGMLGGAARKVG